MWLGLWRIHDLICLDITNDLLTNNIKRVLAFIPNLSSCQHGIRVGLVTSDIKRVLGFIPNLSSCQRSIRFW